MTLWRRFKLFKLNLTGFTLGPRKAEWIFLILLTLLLSAYKVLMNDWNNYRIFYHSFEHLRNGLQLYIEYPEQHFDFFKYSPSFAALMFPFSFLPLWFGALLWNLLGVGVFWSGLLRVLRGAFPLGLLALLLLPELIGQIQNFQSNAILTGILLHTFADYKQEKWWRAGALLGFAFHIKIFGAALGILCLLWGWRATLRTGVWSVLTVIFLFALPLFWIPFSQLMIHYQDWLGLLQWDNSGSQGASFMGVFRAFTGMILPNLEIQIGSLLLMIGAWLINKYKLSGELLDLSRSRSFALLLLWMIVFNHKSESPTFILGMTGFVLWFLHSKSTGNFLINLRSRNRLLIQPTKWKSPTLWLTFFFVSALSSDFIPQAWKSEWIQPLEMKVWPLLALWISLIAKDYSDFFKSRGSKTAAV